MGSANYNAVYSLVGRKSPTVELKGWRNINMDFSNRPCGRPASIDDTKVNPYHTPGTWKQHIHDIHSVWGTAWFTEELSGVSNTSWSFSLEHPLTWTINIYRTRVDTIRQIFRLRGSSCMNAFKKHVFGKCGSKAFHPLKTWWRCAHVEQIS